MRGLASLAIAVAGAVALAGCGSSETTTTTTEPAARQQAPGGAPGGEAFAQLQACLKKHGVTLPGRPQGGQPPQGGGQPPQGGGQPPQIDQSAIKACQKYLPQGGPGAGGGPPGMAPPGSGS